MIPSDYAEEQWKDPSRTEHESYLIREEILEMKS